MGKPGEKLKLQFAEGEKVLRITCKLGAYKADLAYKEPDVAFRVLDTNVGYLRIRTFNGYHLMGEFQKVYPDLLKTRALIIDIRNNGGGNSGNGDFLASSLVADTLMRGLGAVQNTFQHTPRGARNSTITRLLNNP